MENKVGYLVGAIVFIVAWSLAREGMERLGIESNAAYMFVGGLFGIFWFAYLMFIDD